MMTFFSKKVGGRYLQLQMKANALKPRDVTPR